MQFFLEQCLQSVQAATKNIQTEVIVVDNHSSDGSCVMIEKKFPWVNLIKSKNNIGFSSANNLGVEKAKGEYLLILNPDTVLAEDTIDKILNFTDVNKKMGVVGVHFIDGTGKFLPECKRNIPTLKIASEKLFGKSTNYYATQIEENSIAKVDVLSGAFMMMKRSIFSEVKGFDEDYFMFGEDIDLCYKIVNAGYENFYFGEASILHYKGESTVKDIFYFKNFYGAMQLFYKKHFEESKFLNAVGKIVIKGFISYKTLKIREEKQESRKINSLILISDNKHLREKVLCKIKDATVQMAKEVPKDLHKWDMIIFDNTYLSNKKIIKNIKSLEHLKLAKRIIPKNSNFYLGSDSSVDRGEVVLFNELMN